jgi:hypothetical protein
VPGKGHLVKWEIIGQRRGEEYSTYVPSLRCVGCELQKESQSVNSGVGSGRVVPEDAGMGPTTKGLARPAKDSSTHF